MATQYHKKSDTKWHAPAIQATHALVNISSHSRGTVHDQEGRFPGAGHSKRCMGQLSHDQQCTAAHWPGFPFQSALTPFVQAGVRTARFLCRVTSRRRRNSWLKRLYGEVAERLKAAVLKISATLLKIKEILVYQSDIAPPSFAYGAVFFCISTAGRHKNRHSWASSPSSIF